MERFHFPANYQTTVDPEFPGNGDWGDPVYGYDREGRVVVEFRSPWGTPLIVEVLPAGGRRWIGMFAAGGLGGVTGAFATPNPETVCILVDGLAYLVDVTRPGSGAHTIKWQVHQVVPVAGQPVLLLVRMIDMTAVGRDGVVWVSPRLAVDDLRVESTSDGVISCSLDNLGGSPTITLDPMTGRQLSGTQLSWPSAAD